MISEVAREVFAETFNVLTIVMFELNASDKVYPEKLYQVHVVLMNFLVW